MVLIFRSLLRLGQILIVFIDVRTSVGASRQRVVKSAIVKAQPTALGEGRGENVATGWLQAKRGLGHVRAPPGVNDNTRRAILDACNVCVGWKKSLSDVRSLLAEMLLALALKIVAITRALATKVATFVFAIAASNSASAASTSAATAAAATASTSAATAAAATASTGAAASAAASSGAPAAASSGATAAGAAAAPAAAG